MSSDWGEEKLHFDGKCSRKSSGGDSALRHTVLHSWNFFFFFYFWFYLQRRATQRFFTLGKQLIAVSHAAAIRVNNQSAWPWSSRKQTTVIMMKNKWWPSTWRSGSWADFTWRPRRYAISHSRRVSHSGGSLCSSSSHNYLHFCMDDCAHWWLFTHVCAINALTWHLLATVWPTWMT